MAKTIRGINVKIGSDTSGLSAALKDVNKKSRDIRSELRKVERLLRFNPDDTELLAQKQQLLSDRVENTSEKLRRLREVQDQVNEQFEKGEIGEQQYRAFQREIKKTESKLETFENQLDEAASSSSRLARKLQAAQDKLRGIGEKMKSVGESMTMKVTAPLTGAFFALTEGTRDFRKEISVLKNNIDSTTASSKNINRAMAKTKAITGETKDSVEGLSSLLATEFRGDKFQQVLDNLIGASIKFKETIKFEEVANSFQETLARGKAVGQFGELLERSGIQLENFEEGLKQAKKQGTEQNYILQTLAKTGLSEVYEQYRKNNSELIRSAEASYRLREELAELGKTLEPIRTRLTQFATKVAEKFNKLSPEAKSLAITIAGIAAVVGPVVTAMGVFAASLSALLSPVGAVVAAVAALSLVGIEVYRNWEEVKDSLSAIWDFLKTEAEIFATQLQLAFAGAKMGIDTMINAIVQKASVLSKLPGKWGDKFKEFSNSVSQNTKKSEKRFDSLKEKLSGLNDKAVENLSNIGASFSDLGSSVGKDVKEIIGIFADLGDGYDVTGDKAEEAAEKAKKAAENKNENVSKNSEEEKENTKEDEEEKTETIIREAKKRAEALNEEFEKRKETLAKKEDFEVKWTKKLTKQSASRLQILEMEKTEALAKADELGAEKSKIRKFYAQKQLNTLMNSSAKTMEQLKQEKNQALEIAEKYHLDKQAVIEYFAQKEIEVQNSLAEKTKQLQKKMGNTYKLLSDKIKDYMLKIYRNTEKAAELTSKAIVSFVDTVASGEKSFKEVMKKMLLDVLTMLEQKVIAYQLSAEAIAAAMAVWDFGTALARLAAAMPKITATLAGFEGIKAAVRDFKEGGIVTGETFARIGEGKDNEAVLPLNKETLSTLGASIAANMPQQQAAPAGSARPIEFKLQVGTLVADELGLKKLERKLKRIRLNENQRLEVSST